MKIFKILILLLCLTRLNSSFGEEAGESDLEKINRLLHQGKTLAEAGNLKQSIKLLNKAKRYGTPTPELLFYLGISYCRLAQYDEGIDNLYSAYIISEDKNILEPLKNAYFMKGLSLSKKEKFADAETCFSKVIELDNTNGRAYFNRGVCKIVSKEYQSALDDFKNAEQYGYRSKVLDLNKAISLKHLKREEEAVSVYKTILTKYPLYAPAHYNLAILLEKNLFETGADDSKINDAIYHYKRALELDANFYQAAYNIARIYSEQKKLTLAITWIKKSIDMYDNNISAHILLAQLYFHKKSYNNALLQIEKIYKKGYNPPQLKKIQDEIYQITGKQLNTQK